MWSYFATGVIGLIVGAFASPFVMGYVSNSILRDVKGELTEAWSSEGRDWAEFSRFVEAGGRSYWSGETVFNGLQNGMNEEDIRRTLGPPDAVLLGEGEVSNSFKLGPQPTTVQTDRRRPLDYIPYLKRDTVGVYIYKMGRTAYNVSHIEQSVLCLEFSAEGKLMGASKYPVSPSNPMGDFTLDTRTDRRVRSG